MSRIGKQPIPIPSGVKVAVENGSVHVEGPKGKLSTRLPDGVQIEVKDGQVIAKRASNAKPHRANHGLARALLANTVEGVTQGFEKRLDVVGVGYRAEVQGGFLTLGLGFSHPVQVPIPEGIEISVDRAKKTIQQYIATISVKGIDKQAVGQLAADIRALRKPDAYKGKGIRYEDEMIKLKVGKKGA